MTGFIFLTPQNLTCSMKTPALILLQLIKQLTFRDVIFALIFKCQQVSFPIQSIKHILSLPSIPGKKLI